MKIMIFSVFISVCSLGFAFYCLVWPIAIPKTEKTEIVNPRIKHSTEAFSPVEMKKFSIIASRTIFDKKFKESPNVQKAFVENSSEFEELNIQILGILQDKRNWRALIKSEISENIVWAELGFKIEDWELVEIGETRAVFVGNGERHDVNMFEDTSHYTNAEN